MQTVAASLAPPAMPSTAMPAEAAAGTTDSIADFATLLLGQLANGTLPVDPALADAPAETPMPAETLADPAEILAAMGLVLAPAVRTDDAQTAKTSGSSISAAQTALQLIPQEGSGQALADGLKSALTAGDDARAGASLTPLTANTAGSGAATAAANFAGFEQKLAEAAHGAGEGLPQALTGNPMQSTAARPASDVQQHVATPVRDPAWSAEFGQKIVWMATQDKQSAQLTLNPPQMGPIEISLSVRNDQATAVFVSGNAEVREAIEAAMPRLREMLAGVGVELGQTNVSAESFRQAQDNADGRHGADSRGNDGTDDGMARQQPGGSASSGAIRSGNGLVDTFA